MEFWQILLLTFVWVTFLDLSHFIFLKYIKKDKDIQHIDYNMNWWHHYFMRKYHGK